MATKKQHYSTIQLMLRVAPLMAKLRVANNVPTCSDELIESSILNCINSRNGNWRKTAPDSRKFPESELLWKLVKFHRGNGSLYGWPWCADKVKRDQLDTLALLLLNNNSNAVNNWQRELG